MRHVNKVKAGVVTATAFAMAAGMVGTSYADLYPGANDIVGGGSDTIQYTLDFIMDGTPGGLPGYNAGKTNRVFSFDATADANARAVFNSDGTAMAPTVVMRSGTAPVTRPNGSGAGVRALYQTPYISPGPVENFARMSSLPTCQQDTDAANAGFGGLHVFKFAFEHLAMGASQTATNAPAGLSKAEIINIYNGTYLTWGDIPGYAGPAPTATIVPQIPQINSGTRNTFLADLKAANGNVDVPLNNPNLQTVQENDFNSIVNPPASTNPATLGAPVSSANVIDPFSGGRIGLNNSGFFGAAAQNKVNQLTGATPDAGAAYDNQRPLFVVIKENDIASTKIFQPGGTKNFVNTLFRGTGSVLQSPAFSGQMAAAGHTQQYQDLGRANVQGTSCT
jgi:hypothetical protein